MQTFGKALRNSVPSLGLGLVSAFALASVTAVTAPAAIAQTAAKKEFVENFNAANAALSARRYAEAVQKADAASAHAVGTQQKSAIEQIKVGATCAQTKHQDCITAIEKAKSVGGLPAAVTQNYDKMLAGKYDALGQSAKALTQTKSNIDKYGGSAVELQYIARKELDAKNYVEAAKWAQKSIDAKGGATAYNILLNALSAQNKMDEYFKVVERVAPEVVGHGALDLRHARRAAHHDHALHIGHRQSGIAKRPPRRTQRFRDQCLRHVPQVLLRDHDVDDLLGGEFRVEASLGMMGEVFLHLPRP